MNTPDIDPILLSYDLAGLRDDARELATSAELQSLHGTDTAQGWLDLAGDLAVITSYVFDEYVASLDTESAASVRRSHAARIAGCGQ